MLWAGRERALEDLVTARSGSELRRVYAGKRVLLTGHTGFKGGWLAPVAARARRRRDRVRPRAATPMPTLFPAAGIERPRAARVDRRRSRPRRGCAGVCATRGPMSCSISPRSRSSALSYEQPLETIQTNVIGTAHVLEALRASGAAGRTS